MTFLRKSLIAAITGAGILALSVASASAAIVCSGTVCWHVHETYDYPSGARVIIHPDDWAADPGDHYIFREHEGRGYWADDTWTDW